jgi:hypothetical protein
VKASSKVFELEGIVYFSAKEVNECTSVFFRFVFPEKESCFKEGIGLHP